MQQSYLESLQTPPATSSKEQADQLAHLIAEHSAREVVMTYGVQKKLIGAYWLHLEDAHIRDDERRMIRTAVRYLDLRGLIVRSVAFPDHVRIRDRPEVRA